MALSEAQKKKYAKYNEQYKKDHYDKIITKVPKGDKEKIMAFAKEQGKSMNAFVKDLIYREMEKGK